MPNTLPYDECFVTSYTPAPPDSAAASEPRTAGRPLIDGPRWYRTRIRAWGPLVGLLLPAVRRSCRLRITGVLRRIVERGGRPARRSRCSTRPARRGCPVRRLGPVLDRDRSVGRAVDGGRSARITTRHPQPARHLGGLLASLPLARRRHLGRRRHRTRPRHDLGRRSTVLTLDVGKPGHPGSRGDQIADARELGRADARHALEVVDGEKRTVAHSLGNDRRRRCRTHAGERVQQCGVGTVEVDRAARDRPIPPRRRLTAASAQPHLGRARRCVRRRRRAPPGSARRGRHRRSAHRRRGRRRRSATRRAKLVHARLDDRARHMDEDLARLRVGDRFQRGLREMRASNSGRAAPTTRGRTASAGGDGDRTSQNAPAQTTTIDAAETTRRAIPNHPSQARARSMSGCGGAGRATALSRDVLHIDLLDPVCTTPETRSRCAAMGRKSV